MSGLITDGFRLYEKERFAVFQSTPEYRARLMNRTIKFHPFFYWIVSDVSEDFFDLHFPCGPRVREVRLREFGICLRNLKRAGLRFVIPFPFDHTKHNGQKKKYIGITPFSIKVFRKLGDLGLVDIYPGFNNKEDPSMNRITRVQPTKVLMKHFLFLHNNERFDPPEIIVNERKKNGRKGDMIVNWRQSAKTDKITRRIKEINRKFGYHNFEVRLEKPEQKDPNAFFDDLGVKLHMVYTEKTTLHGRLYSGGVRHYQGLQRENRRFIFINDEPTVELDFSGLHPRILYANEGIQFKDDPYLAVAPEATKEKNPALRSLLKHILLVLLNSETRKKANSSGGKWFSVSAIRKDKGEEAAEERQAEIKTLMEAGFEQGGVKKLVDKFYEVHAPISHYFGVSKDTGLKLMNKDGMMALDIVYHFAKQNIPVLPVHDSFIIQIDKAEELREKMDKVYQKFNNGFTCPIK